jgi:hypothetical protein
MVNTVDADLAAVRILTRLGPEVVRLLLSKHHPEAAGFCAGCSTSDDLLDVLTHNVRLHVATLKNPALLLLFRACLEVFRLLGPGR